MAYSTKKIGGTSSSPGVHFWVFPGLYCSIFLYFLRTVWFLMKFFLYIFDNTLMIVRLKNFMGYFPLLEPFEFCFGAHCQYFSLFPEKGLVFFHETLQNCYQHHSGNHTKNNMARCFHFSRLF